MIEKVKEWYENRHEYARKWKEEKGGKVLGYFCTYIPEEIVYAANILPVRILGSHEPPDNTDSYIFGMFCPFCRDCLSQGLKGRYDYLDGIMISQSCLHIRQAFDSWSLHIPVEYKYYLYMPCNIQSSKAARYLAGELVEFKKSLEEWIGKPITEEDIDRGIELVNKNRRLLKEIYELRKGNYPPITGVEAMYLAISSQLVDKSEHNAELERILQELPKRNLKREVGIRLMVVGSENDDIELLDMIERLGTTFVIDDHCTGTRYFWNEVTRNDDKLYAIATRYIDRPPCPSKDWIKRRRFHHILKLAKDWNVQGAILLQQKFCDPHEFDNPPLKDLLNSNNIQCYPLELDVTVPLEQFKIRIEAFVEMLKAEELPF